MRALRMRQTAGGAVLLSVLIAITLFAQESGENRRTILQRVQPQYPALARKLSIQGLVKLEVTVEADGTVKAMNTKGGHPLLVDAAQQAIRQWRWKPESHSTVESIEIRFNP